MPLISNTIIFLDTKFFKEYKPGDASYHDLLRYSQDDEIVLCTSQIVLEEWRTQKVSHLRKAFQELTQRFIDLYRTNIIIAGVLEPEIHKKFPDEAKIIAESNKRVTAFTTDHKIKIYAPRDEHITLTWNAYFQGNPPFKEVKNRKDIPDAWIFESARDALKEEEHKNLQNRFCICGDGTLCDALGELGFKPITVVDLLAALRTETSAPPDTTEPLPAAIAVPTNLTELLAAIEEKEKELQIKIMGYVHWFAPITKTELLNLLEAEGRTASIISNIAERLALSGLIIDTGNYYLPGDKGACEQAANSIMPEILAILDRQ